MEDSLVIANDRVACLAGFAVPEYNVCDGIRCSTAWAYLRPAASRPNLHILHSATVLKVGLPDTPAHHAPRSTLPKVDLQDPPLDPLLWPRARVLSPPGSVHCFRSSTEKSPVLTCVDGFICLPLTISKSHVSVTLCQEMILVIIII